jgi:ABC-2 type transport system ATP-binding protein
MISISNLSKHYGNVVAVDDLNLSIEPGEVFGFIGPNGAGKTTTIRVLVGLLKPTRGSAQIFGMDCWANGANLRNRIGYLPGDLYLYQKMTTRSCVRYFARLRNMDTAEETDRLAGLFNLDLDRPIGQLSKGNRQKAGLIQALAHRPDLLVLDEPTSGLDPLLQQEFLELMGHIRERGQTVFLSSHLLDEVERIADRIGVINSGQLNRIGTVEELRATARRIVEIRFEHPPVASEFADVEGVSNAEIHGTTLKCVATGSMDALMKAAAQQTVVDVRSQEENLEEVFLDMYRENT